MVGRLLRQRTITLRVASLDLEVVHGIGAQTGDRCRELVSGNCFHVPLSFFQAWIRGVNDGVTFGESDIKLETRASRSDLLRFRNESPRLFSSGLKLPNAVQSRAPMILR